MRAISIDLKGFLLVISQQNTNKNKNQQKMSLYLHVYGNF